MLKKSASGSIARRAGLARQARHASSDSECLAFPSNPASRAAILLGRFPVVPDLQAIEVYCAEMVFPQPAREKTSQDIAKRCQSWYNSDPVPI
jgi:hypothetical protein